MKALLFKFLIAFCLALVFTILLYWPLYQKILLNNSNSNINTEINKLNLPISEEIKEILDRKIDLPIDRHQLCLKNNNRFYLVHVDSYIDGMPYFLTNDVSQTEYALKNKAGAMTIDLYYNNGLSKDEHYREIGQPKKCKKLNTEKLENYASSTIEYHHVGLPSLREEIDLGDQGRIVIIRDIVGGSYVDVANSSAYISARWNFFLMTLGTLYSIIQSVIIGINWILKRIKR